MSRLRTTADWWIDHPGSDLVIVGAVAGGVAAIDPAASLTIANHATFFQTLAGVSAALATLGTLAITLLFTVTPIERLDRVLALVGTRLQRLVVRSLGGLVVARARGAIS